MCITDCFKPATAKPSTQLRPHRRKCDEICTNSKAHLKTRVGIFSPAKCPTPVQRLALSKDLEDQAQNSSWTSTFRNGTQWTWTLWEGSQVTLPSHGPCSSAAHVCPRGRTCCKGVSVAAGCGCGLFPGPLGLGLCWVSLVLPARKVLGARTLPGAWPSGSWTTPWDKQVGTWVGLCFSRLPMALTHLRGICTDTV